MRRSKRSNADILAGYLDGERLKTIPPKRSRKLLVLHWLIAQFDVGRRYTEAEVNALIARSHPDFATLRRELYDARLIERENGVYWRESTS